MRGGCVQLTKRLRKDDFDHGQLLTRRIVLQASTTTRLRRSSGTCATELCTTCPSCSATPHRNRAMRTISTVTKAAWQDTQRVELAHECGQRDIGVHGLFSERIFFKVDSQDAEDPL